MDVEGLVSRALQGPIRLEAPGYLWGRLEEARRSYLEEAGRRRVYGYCTGLGALQGVSHRDCHGLEEVVLEEHSVQTGPAAPPGLVRLFLAVRFLQLQRAPAPVRPLVAERILEAVSRPDGDMPVVGLHGSVGASGDLSPSAQAFRCIILGRGRLYGGGNCRSVYEPLELEPGEALALINNTAWSTALCLAAAHVARRSIAAASRLLARAAAAAGAPREHYEEALVEAKNCPYGRGPAEEARRLAPAVLAPPQAPYSLRCIPQVLGPIARSIDYAWRLASEEALASTENPLIHGGRAVHGCNFHAEKIASACDALQGALGALAGLLERAGAQLLEGHNGRPKFLAAPGSSVGAMIIHYSMAALSARVRLLAGRAWHLYTPTSGLQEDLVSMAPEAALAAHEQLRGLARMLGLLRVLVELGEEPPQGPLLGLQERVRAAEEWGLRETGAVLLAGP